MAAEKEEWKIPQLTAENHDTWFRRNKVKLKGKKVFYVCEKNLKLKFLEEKEVRDQQDANEKALPAFRKTEK
ncbi:hypothetical protein A1F99_089740 [Pyrenophora tritici-repentis]|nr:hypothetical protein A1F99_089740 [Pyrenophora tritici-repentis]